MKFVLIGNYTNDCQESMERFALMLKDGLENQGINSTIIRPTLFLGRFTKNSTVGLGKWIGYIDKWIIFPFILFIKSHIKDTKETFFHVCDHSNAFYLRQLPKGSGITCHDVLAIRGALGFKDAYCSATKTGVI